MAMLDGKVTVLTGAAGGIGRGTASFLAREGARLVLSDQPGTGVDDVAADLRDKGYEAVAHEGDVTDEGDVRALVQLARDAYGRLDALDNNAGATTLRAGDVHVTSMEVGTWDRIMAINVRGPMLTMKHAIPLMTETGGGTIVNISSAHSLSGDDREVAYAAGKAALNQLTRSVATAHGRQGIRCNAIAPGIILHGLSLEQLPPPVREVMESNSMVGRLGVPDDIASLVCYLLSDASGYLTGQVIAVDGGHSTHQPHVAQFRALGL